MLSSKNMNEYADKEITPIYKIKTSEGPNYVQSESEKTRNTANLAQDKASTSVVSFKKSVDTF